MKTFTISKILMLAGALWIIIFSILAMTKVITSTNFFGWKESVGALFFIGFFYILIPFSTKPGLWSRLWAIAIALVSILLVIGYFIGPDVNYKSFWTYLMPLPQILMAAGATIWIIQG